MRIVVLFLVLSMLMPVQRQVLPDRRQLSSQATRALRRASE